MRIMIADDETLVRYGLVSVLQDLLPRSIEIIEVSSGVELVEKTREYHPHIAFVDIKMPGMDGLEAIAQVQKFSPNSLWLLLSGHADFSYARAALKLGAEDFLLKPPDPDELKKLLKKLQVRIREKQTAENRKMESRIAAVLGDTTSIQFDPYFQVPRYWQGALILWDSLLPDSEIVEIQQKFAIRMIEMLDGEDNHSGTLVSMRDGRLLLVFAAAVEGNSMDRVIRQWREHFDRLKSAAGDIKGKGISDTWLLTRVSSNVEELFREVEKISRMAALRYLSHPGELMNYNDINGNHQLFRYLNIAELLEELSRTLEIGREDDYHGLVHSLEDALKLLPGENPSFDDPAWFTEFVVPLPGSAPESLAKLIQRLHSEGHELFEKHSKPERNNPPPKSLVEKTITTINRRYRESIGIAQVAEELGVSPNYLSTVFKKETGMSFTRHLTELRLDKSRELLKQPDANIGSIARSLGYQSGRHFTRLFKDRFGTTPSRWMLNEKS